VKHTFKAQIYFLFKTCGIRVNEARIVTFHVHFQTCLLGNEKLHLEYMRDLTYLIKLKQSFDSPEFIRLHMYNYIIIKIKIVRKNINGFFELLCINTCRSQWPRGLRHELS
jgi:hypothetical protein